jgi:ABC-2 type transport system permease protein
MKAFFKQLFIQLRMDLRDKGTLLVFYIVPLGFYAVMGAVFASVTPEMKQTLSAAMAIFAVTMGALIGIPPTLVKMREANILRAYRVNGIPGVSVLLSIGISALIHLGIAAIIIAASAPALFGAEAPQNMGGFACVLFAFLFCSVALGLLIGVSAKSQPTAMMLSQAVFLPSLMLSGIMFPANLLPDVLLYLGRILPSTHAMLAFSGFAYGLTVEFGALPALLIVLGTGIAAAMVTAWQFGRITRLS